MILPCFCEHQFQDERYGQRRRVHNPKRKGDSKEDQKYRCTVCGRERTAKEK